MSAPISQYISLIPSANQSKSNFISLVSASVQPSADLTALYNTIPELYDVDVAVGTQLDTVGQWVGVTRYLTTPLAGVYFAFDTAGVGFDQGVWQGQYDPSTGLVTLPDDLFRLVVKVHILNNHWDGTKAGAYALAAVVFSTLGYSLYIEDNTNLTMNFGLIGAGTPAPIAQALLITGKLNVKPATIHVSNYFTQSAPGPIFAFDINNSYFSGFDTASWATVAAN